AGKEKIVHAGDACFRCHESQKAGELDLEKSSSPAFSSEKQNKLDKNRSDYKNPTYFVNGLKAGC
ncbi:hypothetical protein, partial [Bacillus paralicheniformis]